MLIMLIYRIDVVHAQGRDDFVFASRAAYWIGRRVIWTDHGDLKYIWSDAGPAWIGRKVMKALRYTSKVIVVSKSEYREIAAVCSDMSKFVVVHNGVFPDKISEAVENKEVVIGSTSRLVTAKGIGELIAAFEMIGNSKAKLRIIGDGFEARKFRKLAAASGKAEQIEFMGYRTDVADQLRSMDIFVHPSYHEAFCLSIIEAAMAGLPIVATNTGGNPEIVSPSIGRLVEVKNASSLAAAIEELIQDKKLRRRLGANAARLARRKFDFQKIVHEQVVPLYKGEAK